jgi:hypothetical protein
MISPDLNTAILIVIYGFILLIVIAIFALTFFFWELFKKFKKPKSFDRSDILEITPPQLCKKSKCNKLKCSILITLIITTLSVFLGNLGHNEYQSQMKKRKSTYQVKHLDDTITTTSIEYV